MIKDNIAQEKLLNMWVLNRIRANVIGQMWKDTQWPLKVFRQWLFLGAWFPTVCILYCKCKINKVKVMAVHFNFRWSPSSTCQNYWWIVRGNFEYLVKNSWCALTSENLETLSPLLIANISLISFYFNQNCMKFSGSFSHYSLKVTDMDCQS